MRIEGTAEIAICIEENNYLCNIPDIFVLDGPFCRAFFYLVYPKTKIRKNNYHYRSGGDNYF